MLPRYTPPPHGQDLSELLSIRPGSAVVGGQNNAQSSLAKPAQIAEAFVPHEPGSVFTPTAPEVVPAYKSGTAAVLAAAAVSALSRWVSQSR